MQHVTGRSGVPFDLYYLLSQKPYYFALELAPYSVGYDFHVVAEVVAVVEIVVVVVVDEDSVVENGEPTNAINGRVCRMVNKLFLK